MFIVLGGFQGERAGNDGSWSPGEIVASKGDAGDVKKKKKQKDDMTRHEGRRERRQSVDPWKRVFTHAHAETVHTTYKSITTSPHTTPTIKTGTDI